MSTTKTQAKPSAARAKKRFADDARKADTARLIKGYKALLAFDLKNLDGFDDLRAEAFRVELFRRADGLNQQVIALVKQRDEILGLGLVPSPASARQGGTGGEG